MPFSSLPQTRQGLSRAQQTAQLLGVLIAVLGTLGLVVADVAAPPVVPRTIVVVATALWVVSWLTLLRVDLRARELAEEHARTQLLLTSMTEARRRVLRDDEPRHAVVQAVVDVTGARMAVLSEPDLGVLRVTASAGTEGLPDIQLPLDQPSIMARVYASGRPLRIDDIHDEAGAARSVVESLEKLLGDKLHTVAYVPVVAHDWTLGVLAAAFDRTDVRRADAAVPLLEMLAAEIAVSLERERILSDLQALAVTDALTGIANRRAWQSAVDTMGRDAAMLLLDLDHFKRVNDTWGHDAGDAVLRHFARVLASTTRTDDLCARIGGEEFGVLLHGDVDLEATVERIRVAWRDEADLRDQPLTFSAGGAVRVPLETPSELQRRCDRALYAAKESGRDRFVLADRVRSAGGS